MCINAETSLASFALGTTFNVIVVKSTSNPNYRMMAAIYEFILLMQLLDFISWKDAKCGIYNRLATKTAFVQNMLQPVVALLILLNYTQVTDKNIKLFVSIVLAIYIGVILYKVYYNTGASPTTCLKSSSTCKSLQYDWWRVIGDYSIFTYIIPIIIGFYLLLKNRRFAIIHAIYIIISFILSGIIYSCGIPSIFCLFATGGPILNYMLMKNIL